MATRHWKSPASRAWSKPARTQLTFLANPKYAHKVKNSQAGAIFVAQPLKDLPITSLISSNPYLDFARTLAMFYSAPKPEPGIHPLAFVHRHRHDRRKRFDCAIRLRRTPRRV